MKYSAYVLCYNNRMTIGEAVRSVQMQSVPPSEIFVVDDGSTDGSPEYLDGLGVRVIRLGANQGRGAARAKAMTTAVHEWVLCCDATNILASDFVVMASPWLAKPEVAAVIGRIAQTPGGGVVRRWRERHLFKVKESSGQINLYASLSTWGTLVRKSLSDQVGGYNPAHRHSEDVDLGARLLAQGHSVVYDPNLVVWSNRVDGLWQVLERYWRWHTGVKSELSCVGYFKLIKHSVCFMLKKDIAERDLKAGLITLLLPHAQLYFTIRQAVSRCGNN